MTTPTEQGADAIPCPFCGSQNVSHGEILSSDADGRNRCTQSECLDCGAIGPKAPLAPDEIDYGSRKAIAAWKRRASLPSSEGAGWISVDERLPQFAEDAEDEGVKVYTWDGEFVTDDEFVPNYEQPAGPAVGGWVRADDWFAGDSLHRVTHWMPRRAPAPPGAAPVVEPGAQAGREAHHGSA